MAIVGYARVSSSEQAINSHALDQQIARLVAAGAIEILSDVESGSRDNRPQFRELQRRIRNGEVVEVVATRIDRLSRSLVSLKNLALLCLENEVNLRILDQQIDLATPHGRLMLNMLGSMAEWEVDMLKTRVDAGLRHHRAEGRAPGIVPFGYIRSNDRYSPNLGQYQGTEKSVWEVAQEIVETFLEVQAVRRTATLMGDRYGARANRKGGAGFNDFPRENGLKYWLKNPVLRGHTAYYYRSGKRKGQPIDLVADTHEALIGPSEAAEIDRILSIPSQGTRNFDEPLPLAGLAVCGLCGCKMRAFRYYRPHLIVRWYCRGQHSAPQQCKGVGGIRDEVLEDETIAALIDRGRQLVDAIDGGSRIVDTPEILAMRRNLEQILLMGDSAVIRESAAAFEREIDRLRSELSASIAVDDLLRSELVTAFRDIDFYLTLPRTEKRRLFRRFVSQIVCVGVNQVVITLKV